MKKILLSFSLLLGVTVNAQILTQSNHAYVAGNVFTTIPCNTVGITPGSSGVGSTWDYSSVTTNSSSAVNYSASTSTNTAYPNADVFVSASSTNNSYYKASATELKYYGGNFTAGGFNVSLNYSSPAVYASYPMSFGVSTATAISGTGTILGNGLTFSGQCSILADATGTITLPSGLTYSNVIRVSTSQTVTSNDLGFPIGVVNIKSLNYDYYDPTSLYKAPLFTISTSTITSMQPASTQTFVTVIKDNTIGVKETQANKIELSVYPNPSTSVVNFSTVSLDATKVVISDITGKIIATEQFEMGKTKMNTNNLTAGIYLYNVVDKNNQTLATGKFNVTR